MYHSVSTYQSILAGPSPASPPPGLLQGICPPFESRERGICKFCAARGPGIYQPRGYSRTFETHVVSYQNITTEVNNEKKKKDWAL